MKLNNFLLALLLFAAPAAFAQVTLYSEDFSDNAGAIASQTVYTPSSADRYSWGVSGVPGGLNMSAGNLGWTSALETSTWVSESVFVAGYSALKLNVSMTEAGSFTGSDSVYVYIVEDGTERLVSSQVGNDFESLAISNEACTANVSLQVKILVHNGFTCAVYLDEVSITGTLDFTDVDMDGVDDASDSCIDMDADGTCDNVDATVMLMEEDFSAYAIGTGIEGSVAGTDEEGIAHVEGVTAAGAPGWSLMGGKQKNSVSVRSAAGESYLRYNRTGNSTTDSNYVTLMTRSFDLSKITDPRVRLIGSEITDFVNADNVAGGLVLVLIEDGVEREMFHVHGEFTAVDSIVATTATNKLIVVVKGYAQSESFVQLEQISVYGGYCQTGKDGNGDCQDIGCTDPRACTYSALAITQDVSKCKYLGDACDDGDAANFSDLYKNAGDGTCTCEGFDLQTVYLENFAANGAAQGGLDYGYDGSVDLDGDATVNEDNAALETEWSFDFENADIGTGEGVSPSPFYFATKVQDSDTIMKALNTTGDYMRWTTRSIDVSAFDSVYVSGQLMGLGNQAASDYAHFGWEDGGTLQSPLLAEITGVSSATLTVNEKILVSSGTLGLQVEVETNTSGTNSVSAYGFDDVGVSGLKRGCTDPDASNYEAAPTDGFLARSDDGSCVYDWTTSYSRKDGEFDEVIWGGKPCSEAGYACGSSSVYIDVHSVTENGTRHAVISANTKLTVPAGSYALGELTLESGAELAIPDGLTLTVNGDFHHQGGTISGTGRVIVKGEMDVASGVTSVEVHDFTFATGGSLNLTQGDTLRVKGDLTIDDGSAIAGRMELAGASAQTVSGLDVRFDTLRIASAGVTFAADAQIDGVLDIDQGVVEMDGNTLTFSSDANGTGMLDKIASGGASLEDNNTGSQQAASAVVKRYIAPDGDGVTFWGYSLVGSPLDGASIGDFANATDFYYSGVEGSDYPTSSSTVLFWDEKGGAIVSPGTANTPMDTLGGGAWAMSYGSQNPTLHSAGKLRSHVDGASVSTDLTRTPGSNFEGWNLICNPFQAYLDWDAVIDHGTNSSLIEDQYAIYDTQSKQFVRYSKTNGLLTSAPKYIQPGQGYWVRMNHVTDTTGTLSIPASAIAVNADNVDFVRSDDEGVFDATLLLEIENVYGVGMASVSFGEAGSVEYNRDHDLSLMRSTSINKSRMGVLAGGEWPCVSKALPVDAEANLFVQTKANKETTMRVVGFTEDAEVCVTITDTETGEVMVSRVGDEMTFTLPANEAAEGRFVLRVRPSARVSARPPSCPELEDGRVSVTVGEEPTNVLLTDGGYNVLEQVLGAVDVAVFEGLLPGEYGLVVAGPDMMCGTEHRLFQIGQGEEPELLGLDWTVPACNAGEVSLDFELYGHGDFETSLRLGNQAVWSNMEQGGEVSIAGLSPGTYALEVDHVCLEETVVLDLFDESAVAAEAVYDAVVVMDPIGGAALEAFPACVGEDDYRWLVNGEVVAENEPLFHPVDAVGEYTVMLDAWNSSCSDMTALDFLVVNWNEARLLEAPVTVREDATHWSLVFGSNLGLTQLRMTDAAGRTVWSGQVQAEEGYIYRVERPQVAGTYVMQVTGNGGQWGFPLLNAGF